MKSLFRIPLRLHNAILIMTYLASNYDSKQPIALDLIAEKERISQGYLEEIAAILRAQKLISGTRGQKGGYRLTISPDKLPVSKIFKAVEGPVHLLDCLTDDNCPSQSGCSNRKLWKLVQDNLEKTLEQLTLKELVTKKYKIYA